MTETTDPQALCRTCMTPIGYIDAPTGGWWAHETHPADGHDAVPGGWVDGDELMEAIAAAVWEHCAIEGTASLVVDDPRNIAGTAAAVARRLTAPAAVPSAPAAWAAFPVDPDAPSLEFHTYGANESTGGRDSATAAGQNLTFPTADRAAVLREAADAVRDGDLGPRGGMSRDYENGWWNSRAAAEDRVRRMGDETQQEGADRGDPQETSPTADQQVRGVQAWMALDLHQALGWPVANSAALEHQGRKSWGDWWAELLAGVRNVQMIRRYRGELRRMADEAQQTPEPESGCAHCGGDHAWDDCEAYTALVADEAQQPETQARRTPGPVAVARAAEWASQQRAATVDPAMCPRCKGDNSEAFELCTRCAAEQPDAEARQADTAGEQPAT